MASISATWIILFLVLQTSSGFAARTSLFQKNGGGRRVLSYNGADGLCASMVVAQGYQCEEHTVTTEDGYILSMQRIPVGVSGNAADKPPVLLQHGLFMDGGTWLLNPPDQSLAFILADNGYDVWIANTRGTNYSLGHTSLSPSDSAYWEWSWDELSSYDLPDSVQYVYKQTGQKLHYVGHSLGTLIAFAALSQQRLLDMLRSTALLSPIAHLAQISSPIARDASDLFIADDLYWLGLYEFSPRGNAAVVLLEDLCKMPDNDCSDLMSSFTGQNCCVNSSRTDNFLEHEPQSTSTKNLIHISQMVRKGTLAKYDYGNEGDNMKNYGQTTPPNYDMTSIPNDFPLFLGYGGADMLSDVNDVKVLLGDLQDHDSDKLVAQYIDDYAHADFVFGVNANQVVYTPLMAFFNLN
ncbi:triacylglycerol lipase 2-like [Rutidosis leptorrhynchoides]|uniref:triacylglycerol lipase 2-like n=1 Tax=Rutidosis leptorrhynchoides TaxID=125765 RepID=UPI003A99A810